MVTTNSIQKLKRVQNNETRIVLVLQASRRSHIKPLLHQLHWLPVQQRIAYKLADRRTKLGARPLRFTYTAESRNVSAAEFYVHSSSIPLLDHRSWEQTSLGVLSGFQHRLSGTRCHKQFSSVNHCFFLKSRLKTFCSIRLLLNTDPTCRQRLWSWRLRVDLDQRSCSKLSRLVLGWVTAFGHGQVNSLIT